MNVQGTTSCATYNSPKSTLKSNIDCVTNCAVSSISTIGTGDWSIGETVSQIKGIVVNNPISTVNDYVYQPQSIPHSEWTNMLTIKTDTGQSNISISDAIAKIDWIGRMIVKLDQSKTHWTCLDYQDVKPKNIVKL